MECPYHSGGWSGEPRCELQRLADHTITVTEARAPSAGCILIVVERDDATHTALGASVPLDAAIALLSHHLTRLVALRAGLEG